MTRRLAVVIAGPNGAGKSSAAPFVLRGARAVEAFVNADTIAAGLSAFDPAAVAVEAGRIFLARIDGLISRGANFAWETTLSGTTNRKLFARLRDAGYEIHLVYLWVPTAAVSAERVRRRVQLGGHDIPADTIARRFARSLVNFQAVYRPLATQWTLYDNRQLGALTEIAIGSGGEVTVIERDLWRRFNDDCNASKTVREQHSFYAGEVMSEPHGEKVATIDANETDAEYRSRAVRETTRGLILAHGDVIRRHRAFGVPLVVWRDGRVECLDPNEVPIPDPDAGEC